MLLTVYALQPGHETEPLGTSLVGRAALRSTGAVRGAAASGAGGVVVLGRQTIRGALDHHQRDAPGRRRLPLPGRLQQRAVAQLQVPPGRCR